MGAGALENPAQEHKREQAEIGAHHEHFAVGKIDELGNAVNNGITQRNQRVDHANGQAVDNLLKEDGIHYKRSVIASKAKQSPGLKT
jgi:hypothetical protein